MSTYISNRELEELGEGLTRHYLEQAHIHMAARCIDIEGLANYLGMTVVFETFAEEDRDKVGFLADGRTPLISSHFVSLWGRSCWTPFSGRTKKAAGAASRLLMRSRIP